MDFDFGGGRPLGKSKTQSARIIAERERDWNEPDENAFMKKIICLCQLLLCISLLLPITGVSHARMVTLDSLTFLPPMRPTNVIDLVLSTDVAGSDSDSSIVSGTISALLDIQVHGTSLVPTGLTFTGGQVALSDVSFSFVFGLLQVNSQGVKGFPSTISPPGMVANGQFNAADHQLTFDQGTITGPGTSVDLSVTPLTGPGSGVGSVQIVPVGAPNGSQYTFQATIALPIEINQSFLIPAVPLVGDVNANLMGTGTAVSQQQFTITIVPGDFNADGNLDCVDITELELAVASSSMDLTYDTNLDGVVDGADVTYWLTDLRDAIPGDANLNNVVDGEDFIVWNAHKFTAAGGWCLADFNQDHLVDGIDFIVWNANKFTSGDTTAVPEPLCWGVLPSLVLLTRRGRLP